MKLVIFCYKSIHVGVTDMVRLQYKNSFGDTEHRLHRPPPDPSDLWYCKNSSNDYQSIWIENNPKQYIQSKLTKILKLSIHRPSSFSSKRKIYSYQLTPIGCITTALQDILRPKKKPSGK
jgi:hypothetical protein